MQTFPAHPYPSLRQRILFGFLLVLAVVYIGFEYTHDGDFLIYYQAAADMLQGKNVYENFYGQSHVFPYYSSPTWALLTGILTPLPFPLAAAVWKACSLFFLYRIWVLMESYFDVHALSVKEYRTFVLLSFFSVSFVIYRNFALNQFTVFLLYVVLQGTHWIIEEKKPVLGALLISLGIACKVLPLVIVPYLIYRKEWKGALLIPVCFVAWLLLPAFLVGVPECIQLLQDWWVRINPNNEMNIFDVSTNDIHGLPSLISTLFIKDIGFDQYTLHIRRHIVDLDPSVVVVIIQSIRLLFLLFTLYFLRTLPFVREERPQWKFWELGYVLLVTPLIFPQQRLYAFLFIFPMVTYLAYYLIRLNQERIAQKQPIPFRFYVYVLGLILFNLELIFGNYREHYWHYKTVTYSVFILLYFYASHPPKVLPTSGAPTDTK